MISKATVEQGVLVGRLSPDGTCVSYKGIPYATAPLGSLRWKPPLSAQAWTGERNALDYACAAVQPSRPKNTLTYLGEEAFSEDCLYLNIWTGAQASSERRPVLIWLHFGAFLMGSGAGPFWDGEELARAGIVVVTLNFRLGRMGFLAHPELTAESPHRSSSNYGLLDQIEALRWIRKNIAQFGGDVGNVTLGGQSSGAASISMLMASPLAQGLFDRVIAHSGGQFETPERNLGFPSLSSLEDAERDGVALQEALGAVSIDAMRKIPAADILDAMSVNGPISWRDGIYNRAFICGYPVLDGWVVPSEGLQAVFAHGRQANVPLLIGSTSNEGGGKLWMPDLASFQEAGRSQFGLLAERFLSAYPAKTDAEAVRRGSDAVGDRLFTWQTWLWAELHRTSTTQPVYYFLFSHVPPYPADAKFAETSGDPRTELGAIHSAELPYVFRNLKARAWPWTDFDRTLSRIMSTYWLKFARHGSPNDPHLPQWQPFDGNQVMEFGDTVAMRAQLPGVERLRFWSEHFKHR